MDDALVGALHVEKQNPMLAAVAFERFKLRGSYMVCQRQVTVLGRDGVVHNGEGQVGPSNFAPRDPEAGKSLRRCPLVDEVAVDIDESGLAGLVGNEMSLPDLCEHGASRHKC